MRLDDLARAIPISSWPDSIQALLARLAQDPLPQAEVRELYERTRDAFEKGKRHTVLALFVLGLLSNQDWWLRHIKREGLLRPSKQRFRRGLIDYLLSQILDRSIDLALTGSNREYFEALQAFNAIDRAAHDLELGIDRELIRSRVTAVRSCLVLVDLWFFTREIAVPLHEADPLCQWAENIADGFSFLYYLFSARFPPATTFLGMTDSKRILEGEFLRLLADAAAVRTSREWEMLVEHFGYRCFRKGADIIVESRDPTLEKSIRLGYLLNEQEKRYWAERQRSDWRPHLAEVAERFYEAWKLRGIEYVESPYPRLRIHIPEAPDLWNAVRDCSWFAEEATYLEAISNDLRMPVDGVLECSVSGKLTFRDLLILQRFINVIRYFFNQELKQRFMEERTLVINSLVPVFKRAALARFLGMMIDEQKVAEAIQFLTWASQSQTVFDVMYQPVIEAHEEFHVPFNILGAANIVRNTLQLTHLRVNKEIRVEDPLEDVLAATLSAAGAQTRERIRWEYDGVKGDIDVIAILDDILLILECKGSLHPCNTFELRASYDLIRDGERQLDRIAPLLTETEFMAYLGKKIGFRLGPTQKVACAIVVGNRMFAGWRVGKYPVRSLAGLMSFINSGEISVAGQRVRIRSKGPIQSDALLTYFDSDSGHARAFDAMEPVECEATFGSQRLVLKTFELDWIKYAEILGLDVDAARQWISDNEHLTERRSRPSGPSGLDLTRASPNSETS